MSHDDPFAGLDNTDHTSLEPTLEVYRPQTFFSRFQIRILGWLAIVRLSICLNWAELALLSVAICYNAVLSTNSLWWCSGSERITPCLLLCQGLPPVKGFAALLAGDWAYWGWMKNRLAQNRQIKVVKYE